MPPTPICNFLHPPPSLRFKLVSLRPPPHIPHQLCRPLLPPSIHLHYCRLRHLVLGPLAPVIKFMLDLLLPSLPRHSTKRILVRRGLVWLVCLVLCCRGGLLSCASAAQEQTEHDQRDQRRDAKRGADARFGGCGEPAVVGSGGWGCGCRRVRGRACGGGSGSGRSR